MYSYPSSSANSLPCSRPKGKIGWDIRTPSQLTRKNAKLLCVYYAFVIICTKAKNRRREWGIQLVDEKRTCTQYLPNSSQRNTSSESAWREPVYSTNLIVPRFSRHERGGSPSVQWMLCLFAQDALARLLLDILVPGHRRSRKGVS